MHVREFISAAPKAQVVSALPQTLDRSGTMPSWLSGLSTHFLRQEAPYSHLGAWSR